MSCSHYKNQPATQGYLFFMVELQGFEPWTSPMPWARSSQLSYSPLFFAADLYLFSGTNVNNRGLENEQFRII